MPVFIAVWKTPTVGHQFQSSKRQSSSLFDVSSLPWSQQKSMSPGLFAGAGDDSFVSKFGNFLFSRNHFCQSLVCSFLQVRVLL